VKSLPYLHKLPYRYGLYFITFYDIGTVWNEDDEVRKIRFQNGAGIGLNAIMPFGMIGKIEWAARLSKPTVGQVIFGLGAKF
jgi:outer membrane translocation and assembly module TamA